MSMDKAPPEKAHRPETTSDRELFRIHKDVTHQITSLIERLNELFLAAEVSGAHVEEMRRTYPSPDLSMNRDGRSIMTWDHNSNGFFYSDSEGEMYIFQQCQLETTPEEWRVTLCSAPSALTNNRGTFVRISSQEMGLLVEERQCLEGEVYETHVTIDKVDSMLQAADIVARIELHLEMLVVQAKGALQ